MSVDLVIYDCDGVLIDSEIISAQMLIEELRGYGVEIDRAFVTRHFLGRSYPVVIGEIRATFGVTLPDNFEADYRERLLNAFKARLKVMPGAGQALRETRCPWCVATSSSRPRAEMSLAVTGLAELVGERLFTASSVRNGKPAPDLFLFAAERMNARPDRCLVVEDSLNGIRAARAAGMPVVRFVGGSHLTGMDLAEPEDATPDLRVETFEALFAAYPVLRGQAA